MEKEIEGSINYLDLTINRNGDNFSYKIYRKPTTSSALIPENSCHHPRQKHAAFRSMTQRMLRIPLSESDRDAERSVIMQLGRMNGYHQRTINKIIRQEELKTHPLYSTDKDKEPKIWRCLSYYQNEVAQVEKILNKQKVSCAFKTSSNLIKVLKQKPTLKDRLKMSGVYRVKCDECEKFYIGETRRSIATRIKEHRECRHRSTFGRHLLDAGHSSKNDNNIKILHCENRYFKLNFLEAYEIWKERHNQNLLNEQVFIGKDPLFKYVRITSKRF